MSEERIEDAIARIDSAMARIAGARASKADTGDGASAARLSALVERHEKLREDVSDAIAGIDAAIARLEG